MLKDAALRKAAAWFVAALLYLFWPWDLIPDFVPLVGWVDDALITSLGIYMAWRTLKKRWERLDQERRIKEAVDAELDDGDPYKVLGLGHGASPDAVKAAYRARMNEYHPDKVAHLGAELKDLAEKKSKAIRRAYEALGGT